MGVDLGDSFYLHTVLLVTDLLTSAWNAPLTLDSYADSKNRFQRFEIYIGDDPNYLLNEKVEGGPWLYDPSDPNDQGYTLFTS